MTPRGDYWRVEGDQVITDEEGGDPVPGVLPRPSGPESCGLVVEQMQEWHVGDWDCQQGRLKYHFLLTLITLPVQPGEKFSTGFSFEWLI